MKFPGEIQGQEKTRKQHTNSTKIGGWPFFLRIWGYKGTIYKLRVDCGKESARVLFTKTPKSDIVLLHGFLKKTPGHQPGMPKLPWRILSGSRTMRR